MMKAVALALRVALLTAAVAAMGLKKREGNCRKDHSCIVTITELEKSLFQRKLNIDRLQRAFFPTDQHSPVAVDLVFHFSTSLQNTSEGLCNPPIRFDNGTFDYKFRWSESTVLLFIRPELLRPLSLFVYQGVVTTAEIVIEPICDNNVGRAEHLLNALCIHVRIKFYTSRKFYSISHALAALRPCYMHAQHETDHCSSGPKWQSYSTRCILLVRASPTLQSLDI